ncbi:MAG: hypothetical protein LUC43_06065 [Burkholderiales bacterium]|nr:hypothetical protein [Burkholderiales bacterium]
MQFPDRKITASIAIAVLAILALAIFVFLKTSTDARLVTANLKVLQSTIEQRQTTLGQLAQQFRARGCGVVHANNGIIAQPGCFYLPGYPYVAVAGKSDLDSHSSSEEWKKTTAESFEVVTDRATNALWNSYFGLVENFYGSPKIRYYFADEDQGASWSLKDDMQVKLVRVGDELALFLWSGEAVNSPTSIDIEQSSLVDKAAKVESIKGSS